MAREYRSERIPQEATLNRIIQNVKDTLTSKIILVWVSATSEPDCVVLAYALLETLTDTTFMLDVTAKVLHTKNKQVQLKLSTMARRNTAVSC